MDFQLVNFHRDIPDEELISDLRRAHEMLRVQDRGLTYRSYTEVGKYSAGTLAARFGCWNAALTAAGISITQEKNVSREALFENLKVVWLAKSKQPTFREMAVYPSKYRGQLYAAHFGSWRSALQEFVEFVETDEFVATEDRPNSLAAPEDAVVNSRIRRTNRSVSERMRFRILLRDGFSCQACGASPLKSRGVVLHVDHLLPWSKGGATEESNLQTRCSRCNLGKGNAFNQ